MLFLVIFALLFSLTWAQSACSCSPNLTYDPNDECFSVPSDLMFTRYKCPVVNASGFFQYCGSSYCLGDFSCNLAGQFDRRKVACEAIGGNSVDTRFVCRSGSGANQTELNCQFLPPLLSTSSSTSAPTSITNAPTSAGNLFGSVQIIPLFVIVMSFLF